jgi:histidinol-phosphate aminotransferase
MSTIIEQLAALVRPNIQALKPYSSARDEAPDGTENQPRIMLDANENSFGGPLGTDYSRYPDPQQRPLKAAFARLKGLDPAQIFLGNGSDEAIDLLLRAFVEPGRDNIVLMPPTYGMYAVQANIHGAEIRKTPLLPDFSPDADAVRRVCDSNSKVLFLCSPNNPTGQCLSETFILEMLATFPGLVVVDEAYADFSAKASWVTRLAEFPNLVVLQTLSKAWGLAGLRIGGAFSNSFIISTLNKIKYPYNLNDTTIRLATQALGNETKMQEKVALILAERSRLAKALEALPNVQQVFPSDANFLLIRVSDADALYQYLAQNGVIVRNRSREIHCENCLRITIGTSAENDDVLRLIRSASPTTSNLA